MATIKQRRAVIKMVETGGNASKAMRDRGYSPNTAVNPDKLTRTKGFREVADELGLTDNFILSALHEDIDYKQYRREPELRLAAKIKGMLSDKIDITSDGKPLVIPQALFDRYTE